MIYLDNNATTNMSAGVKKALLEWCNRGNPSASYASARKTRDMMNECKEMIAKICNFKQCCREERDATTDATTRADPAAYKIFFTSGATEANCTIVRSVCDAYRETTGLIPHVVISDIEHKSLHSMVHDLVNRQHIMATFIKPHASGHISPTDINEAIKPNTALVVCMHSNNETGAINNIKKIGELAHKKNVPLHCDTVQSMGKVPFDPVKNNVDSFCISFHKLHGPPGVGALVVKQQLYYGYKLLPVHYGTQNEGFRGGTENVPGIGASLEALKYTFSGRQAKSTRIFELREYIIQELAKRVPTTTYGNYVAEPQRRPEFEIVFISGTNTTYLPNTLLLSVARRSKEICNAKLKNSLEKKGIVISVGSACNTANTQASHVLYAMGADEIIRRGALRISLGDETTPDDAKKFVQELLIAIKQQL
jgi:cysteine desulfurase